ncbi:hypothetical protein [Mesorhizobium sp. A623]
MNQEKGDIHLGNWQFYRLKPLNAFLVTGDANVVYASYPRVSSTFQTFDIDTMSGTTERGRCYFLHGERGHGLRIPILGTLNGWLDLNGYKKNDIEPASPEEVDAVLNLTGPKP